jgi:hypothetical protein
MKIKTFINIILTKNYLGLGALKQDLNILFLLIMIIMYLGAVPIKMDN